METSGEFMNSYFVFLCSGCLFLQHCILKFMNLQFNCLGCLESRVLTQQ